MQAMMQLGKLKNPISDKVERDLEAAQISIDILEALKTKTSGNLDEDEKQFLETILAELKLNFVAEKNKGDDKPADGTEPTNGEPKIIMP